MESKIVLNIYSLLGLARIPFFKLPLGRAFIHSKIWFSVNPNSKLLQKWLQVYWRESLTTATRTTENIACSSFLTMFGTLFETNEISTENLARFKFLRSKTTNLKQKNDPHTNWFIRFSKLSSADRRNIKTKNYNYERCCFYMLSRLWYRRKPFFLFKIAVYVTFNLQANNLSSFSF